MGVLPSATHTKMRGCTSHVPEFNIPTLFGPSTSLSAILNRPCLSSVGQLIESWLTLCLYLLVLKTRHLRFRNAQFRRCATKRRKRDEPGTRSPSAWTARSWERTNRTPATRSSMGSHCPLHPYVDLPIRPRQHYHCWCTACDSRPFRLCWQTGMDFRSFPCRCR